MKEKKEAREAAQLSRSRLEELIREYRQDPEKRMREPVAVAGMKVKPNLLYCLLPGKY